ncbi:MAG: extracellular solute-binding protein [Chitinivibrionales bacterium]|nr:extracellular solute-binding protein [Chitinivibrionales bacterium]MBD3394880.1 extracellular solute-binding protein [Chitinivibrionales bacterium]
MKWVLVIAFALAVLLSVVASVTQSNEITEGVVCTLVWATDDNPARKEQMELFREWHLKRYHEPIDIRIDPSNYDRSKVVVQSLSGAGPDLFDYFSHQNLERYIASGIILDVTDIANEKGFNKETVWKGVWPSFVGSDGRQYAFPDNVCNYLLIYHKDMFDEAGVPYPSNDMTWSEFLELAKKLSFVRPDGTRQYALLMVDPLIMIMQNGGELFTPHGTECILNSTAAAEALQFYRDMRFKHKIMPTPADLASMATAGGWGSGNLNMFATMNFATVKAGRYWFIGFERDTRQMMEQGKEPPYNLGVAEVPYFTRRYDLGGARCTGVSRTSKNVKYAVRFLEFLASEPFNNQINRTYDALAPVKEYCRGDSGWDIADGPDPLPGLEAADDPIWAEAMAHTHEWQSSPFIPPYRVGMLWNEAKELFDADVVTPQEAVDMFARLVNEEMSRNIEKDPELKAEYDAALELDREWRARQARPESEEQS